MQGATFFFKKQNITDMFNTLILLPRTSPLPFSLHGFSYWLFIKLSLRLVSLWLFRLFLLSTLWRWHGNNYLRRLLCSLKIFWNQICKYHYYIKRFLCFSYFAFLKSLLSSDCSFSWEPPKFFIIELANVCFICLFTFWQLTFAALLCCLCKLISSLNFIFRAIYCL